MEKDITLEYAAFLRSFKRNIDVPHSFLLGAGASISSGYNLLMIVFGNGKKIFSYQKM